MELIVVAVVFFIPCGIYQFIQYYKNKKEVYWIHRNDDYYDWLECSNCGFGNEGEVKFNEGTNYCPNCGKKMKNIK